MKEKESHASTQQQSQHKPNLPIEPNQYGHLSMTDAEFSQAMIQAMHEMIPSLNIQPTGEVLSFRFTHQGSDYQGSLQSSYSEYCRGVSFDELLDSRINSLKGQIRPATSTVASQFFPALRSHDYVAAIEAQCKSANLDQKIYYQSFVGHNIDIMYMKDTPENISMVIKSDLEQAGITEENLPSIALANFHNYWQGKVTVEKLNDYDIYIVSLDNNYESSLMLDEAFWQSKLVPLTNQYLAFIPARSILILSDVDKRNAITALQLCHKVFREHGYPLSPEAFMRIENTWAPIELEITQAK